MRAFRHPSQREAHPDPEPEHASPHFAPGQNTVRLFLCRPLCRWGSRVAPTCVAPAHRIAGKCVAKGRDAKGLVLLRCCCVAKGNRVAFCHVAPASLGSGALDAIRWPPAFWLGVGLELTWSWLGVALELAWSWLGKCSI